jgi:alpha-tubulin suppressor-like RCC1 family protein
VAGTNHTCALLKDNTVKCWGDNTYNQLGNGNDTPSVLPAPVVTSASPTTPLGQVTALALRTNHTCAVQSSGSVYCWGDNDSGQLGNGNTDPATVAVKAANVQAVAVSVGDTHSCVLASGGTMQCWGSNFWYGELGDGTNIDSVLPVTAKIPGKASAIGLGSSHSCAVVDITNGTKGAIECWGRNFYGQLGNGKTIDSAVPVSALALSQAQSVAGGEEYTCAVISGGAVYCWGDNYFGQLGDGLGAPNVESYIPKLVVGF